MTEENPQLYNLSRRKVLAGIGAVGLASAGAGLGTSAMFSDVETFAENELVAGELDLLVDWQQMASFGDGWQFVNAHPDHDGDGEQSIITGDEEILKYSDFPDEDDPDSNGANIPLLGCDSIPPLSEADFGVDPVTGEPMETLVQFSDVKPGDEGEITFSLHLCDNPGYIWMQADNITEDGGLHPDPEAVLDPDNDPDLGDAIQAALWYDEDCDNVYDQASTTDIMLTIDFSGSMLYDQYGGVISGDAIQINGTTYDETTKIDLVEKGVRQFIDYLQDQEADVKLGVAYFDGEGSDDEEPRVGILQGLTSDLGDVDAAVSQLRQKLANVVSGGEPLDPFDGDGDPDPYSDADGITTGTYIGEGVDVAQEELDTNGRSGVDSDNIVLSDGESFNGTGSTQFSSPTEAAEDARAGSASPATNLFTIAVGSANDSVLQSMAGPADGSGGDPAYFFDVDDPLNIPPVFGNLAARVISEKMIRVGTLNEVLDELTSGNGIPLDGNRATIFDEFEDDPTDEDREAFRGSGVMHCIGLSWEVPLEVGNEIQGDTMGFDLGFYTEQERNNDGSGPTPA
ncbi:MAG: SipW-dependent-type signal peptide-containing protein [Halodesulfurarchaeum sp.]